jgi:hypothetical protein
MVPVSRHEGATMKRLAQSMIISAVLAAATLPGVAAEKPTPTPAATPTPTARPSGGQALNEVAGETRLKGGEDGKAIVITNENLAEIAEKGSVTSVSKSGSGAGARRPVRAPGDVTVLPPTDPEHSDERRRYWRGQYERQVNLIENLQRQIDYLDQEIPGLWTDFYSRDDPAYRDGVIKPKLDDAMARRQRVEKQLNEARPRLTEIQDQARRDGAEPGWFRGIPTPAPAQPSPNP